MEPRRNLFRKAALDKMASPERLDEMMEVTAPAGWAAAGALGLLVLAGVLWGIFGSLSLKVQGRGILLRGEAVREIAVGVAGRLEQLRVGPGDIVEADQVVASVVRPDLAPRIDNVEEELASLRSQTREQAARARGILGRLREQKRDLEEKVQTQEDLVERGLLTRSRLLDTQAQLTRVEQEIARNQDLGSARSNRIQELEHQLEELRGQLASTVESPYTGKVVEVMVDEGSLLAPGMALVTLEALEGPIDAVVYVPAREGKRVEVGMEARISPSTVRSEEYGFILGTVKAVSGFPKTPEGMANVLGNRQLAESLAGESPQIEVVVSLQPDPETESGFGWSSSGGPPGPVYTGTLCTALVVVERKRPIAYVLPVFKDALGVS